MSKHKLKLKNKPWITCGIQKSISVKNKLLSKFIKLKDADLKNEAHFKYKQYRNLLSTSLKRSEQSHFANYFQKNINDLKNTWKDIKKVIYLKRTSNSVSSAVIENNITLTKPKDIANAFNKYFINISSSIQSTIKFSRNKFHDFLRDIEVNSFSIKPVDEIEIKNIFLSLNPLKAVGPNSIVTKILKLLSNDISNQLSELFNLSFSLGVFPSFLKPSKAIPIFKKESKPKC